MMAKTRSKPIGNERFSLIQVAVAILALSIMILCGGGSEVRAESCPLVPLGGGESIDYFITDRDTGKQVYDGMVVPTGSWLYLDSAATALGQCELLALHCEGLPPTCWCILAATYERTVNHIGISLDAQTQGGLNGHYAVGNIVGKDPATGYTAFYHVLDSRDDAYSSGTISNTLSYPGAYTYNFDDVINTTICNILPGSVVVSATVYASDLVNDDCNTRAGKGVGVSSGVAVAEETDFSISGAIPLGFSRYYNSKTAQTVTRSFGRTWGSVFDTRIESLGTGGGMYKATNPDGSVAYYRDANGDGIHEAVVPQGDTSHLTRYADNTYMRAFKNGTTEGYNSSGYLTSMTDRNGNVTGLSRDGGNRLTLITDPFGRTMPVVNDASSRIIQISLPGGGAVNYTYSGNVLQKATYPGGASRNYEYAGYYLTGIKNENGKYVKKYTYDGYGRVTTSSADGTIEKVTFAYVNNTRSTVTDSLGRVTTYFVDKTGGRNHATEVSGPGCGECGPTGVAYAYDNNLNVVSMLDPNGNTTTYTYDAYGNMLTKTEGSGSPVERTTTYTYDGFGQPLVVTDPDGHATTNTYDVQGNLLSTSDPLGNTTSHTYDSRGLRTSTTDPEGNTTTYTYDSLGNPMSTVDPLGYAITFTSDAMGRVLTTTAAGATTTNEYDARGWLTRITAADNGVTSFEYDLAGNKTAVTDPTNNRTVYTYDNVSRLIKITDPGNNTVNYAYDNLSNVTSVSVKNSAGVVKTSATYTYDDHNRLSRTIHPDGKYSERTYDGVGNVVSYRDENGHVSAYAYDALNRLVSVTDPLGRVVSYGYDAMSNLTSILDPNGNETMYAYDVSNRRIATSSTDTGAATYGYDGNGNLLTKTDALGATVSYGYDALNRLAQVSFPDTAQNISYGYDNCVNGTGRICGMTDPSGTTSYEYNIMGKVAKATMIIDGIPYVSRYGYDPSGNTTSITYPSGRVITNSYTNNRVTGILSDSTPVASNISYMPFGGVTSITYGNGLVQSTGYDQRYRITTIASGGVQNLAYSYDNAVNVTGISNNLDSGRNKTYAYDAYDRLSTAAGPWGSIVYAYDNIGNRLTETTGAGTTNYGYQANRLVSGTGVKSFVMAHDNNGNTLSENSTSLTEYVYNQNERLIQSLGNSTSVGEYAYNGLGQRVKKSTATGTVIFHYDLGGRLIAESTGGGTITAEYIFANDSPVAKIEGGSAYFYQNDHLRTPQKMTNSLGTIVWDGEFLPFGEPWSVIGEVTNNLRFPGQYFDAETGLHQNYFRDYDPKTGRYIEADPIGLEGGINIYAYVENAPLNYYDHLGLLRYNKSEPDTGRLSGETLKFAECVEKCSGFELTVTGGSEKGGHTKGSKHYSGEACDFGKASNPKFTLDIAKKCFSECAKKTYYGQEEGKLPHFHFQIVPGIGGATGFAPKVK
jgi:RHS repeat-associated protein